MQFNVCDLFCCAIRFVAQVADEVTDVFCDAQLGTAQVVEKYGADERI